LSSQLKEGTCIANWVWKWFRIRSVCQNWQLSWLWSCWMKLYITIWITNGLIEYWIVNVNLSTTTLWKSKWYIRINRSNRLNIISPMSILDRLISYCKSMIINSKVTRNKWNYQLISICYINRLTRTSNCRFLVSTFSDCIESSWDLVRIWV